MSVIFESPYIPIYLGDPDVLANDTEAPVISSIEVTEVGRYAGLGEYFIKLDASAFDDASGVARVEVVLDFDGYSELFTLFDKDLGQTVHFAYSGNPDLSEIRLVDATVYDFADNSRTYLGTDPALPFSAQWSFDYTVDKTGPVPVLLDVSNLQLSPDGLTKTLTFRLDATDDGSGVDYAHVALADRHGTVFFQDWIQASDFDTDLMLTAPAVLDLSEVHLHSLSLSDRDGNITRYEAENVPDWWATTGLASDWTFADGATGADVTAPVLGQAEILGIGYNAQTDSDTITVRLSAADDLTGVDYVELGLVDAAGTAMGHVWWDAADLDKVLTYDIPGRFDVTTLHASYVLLRDALGNTRTLSQQNGTTDLADLGHRTTWNFTVSAAARMGDEGDNTLDGTQLHDDLQGLDGNDILKGFDGRDLLSGGAGDDLLLGGSGADILRGGDGNDALYADHAADDVDGGAGYDTLHVMSSDLQIDLGVWRGIEAVRGSVGSDRVDGAGTYKALDLRGFGGNDTLIGGSANDVLVGGSGWDKLYGGASTDLLIGGEDGDRMDGGENSDIYYVGFADTVTDTGTVGYDKAQITTTTGVILDLSTWSGVERINGNIGRDEIDGSSLTDSILMFGNDGDDKLTGGSADDVLLGGENNDTLEGQGGNDVLVGGAGHDLIRGGDGNDIVILHNNDTVHGGAGFDHVKIVNENGIKLDLATWSGVERISGNAGSDQIDATDLDGAITMAGSDGADRLTGSAFGDVLFGGAGADVLAGGDGADALIGGQGNDTLIADTDTGFFAKDFLLGGTGADRFIWAYGFGRDVVRDFTIGEDVLELAFFGVGAFNNLHLEQHGANTVVKAAAGATDFLVLVDVLATDLSAGDFDIHF